MLCFVHNTQDIQFIIIEIERKITATHIWMENRSIFAWKITFNKRLTQPNQIGKDKTISWLILLAVLQKSHQQIFVTVCELLKSFIELGIEVWCKPSWQPALVIYQAKKSPKYWSNISTDSWWWMDQTDGFMNQYISTCHNGLWENVTDILETKRLSTRI